MAVSDVAGGLFGSVAPRVGPVRDPSIDGMDATAELTVPSTTPTVRWSPPAIGAPDAYIVSVYRVGGGLTGRLVASFTTAQPELALPAGVMEAGQTHYLRITAEQDAGQDFAAAPRRRTDPVSATSTRPTALIHVQ